MHMIRLQVKPKEDLKIPIIQESVSRPSIVKVPLVKMPKGEQKEEKESESEEMIQKSEAQNPRVGHNNAAPTVSASQAPDPKPNPVPPMKPRRSAKAHNPNPRYMDTIVKEIGNTMNYLSGLSFMKAKKTVNIEYV